MEDAIAAINERLKNASIPVRVRLNGKKLVLRATLPKKPEDGGVGTKQYDLSLGIPASREGLKRIEIEAQKLGGLLAMGQFSWTPYLKPKDKPQEMTVAQLVPRFKAEYMRSSRIQETTWRETWQRTFDRLPQDEPLSETLVLAVVLSTDNHTRIREQTCQRLQKLADFAGLAIDLKPYKGGYGEDSTEPRDIPDDELIREWYDQIPNPQWQWVYGMLAVWGLRPHEVFHCEFIDRHRVRVNDGKTKMRIARAIPSEWAVEWNLIEVRRPNVSGKSFRDYGQRVSRQFNRYKVPFVPYDLRHAFAIRASVVKRMPVSTAASLMGHSTAVHLKTYHRWLTDATNEQVYRSIILGEDQNS
ncbi:MAG: site-specific integrase [Elainellaceae cyanobacterium]